MTTPQPDTGAGDKSMPARPEIKEPDIPLPKEAQQSRQQAGQGSAQQQAGQGGAQQQAGQGEYGEGNYKAARDYDDGLKRHMQTHDIEKEARDAAPKSRAEADDIERAEDEGRARAHDDNSGDNNA
jgi:hypothetical protein